MNLTLEQLAARLEACELDLEAHRGYIITLEYGLRTVMASHPNPNEASVMGTDALIAAAKTRLRDACENYRTALSEHRRT
jgi:hypothetical protein